MEEATTFSILSACRGWQYCANDMAGKLSHPWIHAKTGKADQSEEASAAYPWIHDYRNNGS